MGAKPPPSGPSPRPRLEIIDVGGTGYAAGREYGEAAAEVIVRHHAAVLERAWRRRSLTEGQLYDRAQPFRAHVEAEFPALAAEVDGIADGAGLAGPAAWLLQLRAEVFRVEPSGPPAECTSFGVASTADTGSSIAGQNADLPAFYRDVLVLMRRRSEEAPRLLTLTPAGQVGWHGMNEHGVSVFANFLYSGGWRPGIPRYLFTRIALEFKRAREGAARLMSLRRGSPRNVLFADPEGVFDVEFAVEEHGTIEPVDGVVIHANHHVSDIDHLELASDDYLRNSRRRHERMRELVSAVGRDMDVDTAVGILRDRVGVPDALCRAPEDRSNEDDSITVASTVADTAGRRLWIAVGPPHESTYHEYEV